jgi:hypothetical protein
MPGLHEQSGLHRCRWRSPSWSKNSPTQKPCQLLHQLSIPSDTPHANVVTDEPAAIRPQSGPAGIRLWVISRKTPVSVAQLRRHFGEK